jgi:hypothetical protein
MKTTLSLFTLIALALSATPAMAQQTGSITIGGNAPAACSASGTFVNIALGNLVDMPGGGLKFSAVNGKTATNTTALFCNGVNSTLSLTANTIVASAPLPSGAATAGFANQVNYRATATLLSGGYSSDAITATDESDITATPGTPDLIGLLAAPVNTLQITLSDASLPGTAVYPIADNNYSGSVTLTIAAQL